MKNASELPCFCDRSGKTFGDCCRRVHQNPSRLGLCAEDVMRARYSAYVAANEPFLLISWHPSTRPSSVDFDPTIEWLGLEVVAIVGGAALDAEGTVEFRARFRRGNEHLELHETSTFLRQRQRWLYVDGD